MRTWVFVGAFLIAIILSNPPAYAYIDASAYGVTMDIGNGYVHETVSVNFTSTEKEALEIRLTADPEMPVAILDGQTGLCTLRAEVGSSVLLCDLLYAGQHELLVEYKTAYPLIDLNGKKLAIHKHTPAFNSDLFRLEMKLPQGGIIKDIDSNVAPKADEIWSDGKRIIVSWERKSIAAPFEASIVFDAFERTYGVWVAVGVVLLILSVLLFIFREYFYEKFMEIFGKSHKRHGK
jgi:hypothetical protein